MQSPCENKSQKSLNPDRDLISEKIYLKYLITKNKKKESSSAHGE